MECGECHDIVEDLRAAEKAAREKGDNHFADLVARAADAIVRLNHDLDSELKG